MIDGQFYIQVLSNIAKHSHTEPPESRSPPPPILEVASLRKSITVTKSDQKIGLLAGGISLRIDAELLEAGMGQSPQGRGDLGDLAFALQRGWE